MNSHNLLRKQVASEIRKRRLIFSTIVFLSLLYLGAHFLFGNVGFLKYRELRDKKIHLEKELQEIEMKNEHLRSEVKMFKENPFYMEKHARENFGMAKPDELIFKYDR